MGRLKNIISKVWEEATKPESHIKGDDFFVIKIATGFYDNPSLGRPSSNGVMVVFSTTSGEPVALLKDEGWLTDMRTGIGGAITTIELAPNNAKNLIVVTPF